MSTTIVGVVTKAYQGKNKRKLFWWVPRSHRGRSKCESLPRTPCCPSPSATFHQLAIDGIWHHFSIWLLCFAGNPSEQVKLSKVTCGLRSTLANSLPCIQLVFSTPFGKESGCKTSYNSRRKFKQTPRGPRAYPSPFKDDLWKDSSHLGYWRDLEYAPKICSNHLTEKTNPIWNHYIYICICIYIHYHYLT